ncbi:hypothetical protein JCGZ_09958 [Jatropha curcas]|uniref:Uncharacterized protein n=1 Tax=Jatropha curcas TaxID=180498 RepID=A0A067JL79_JATCU|nr:hypothetical protein JCGZ_09958 [Jatropha curcas]
MNEKIQAIYKERAKSCRWGGNYEYPNFEAQKASFSRTANSPAGPEAIRKVHRKYANMVLETSRKLRGSQNWSRNIFWRLGTPGKASGMKRLASPPVKAAPAAGKGGVGGSGRPPA